MSATLAERFVLGTAQFGLAYGVTNQNGKVTPSEAKAIIQHCQQNGITHYDTAIMYGDAEVSV